LATPGTVEQPPLARALVAEGERIVAWLRLPAIVLLAAGHTLGHPEHDEAAFLAAIAAYAALAAGMLALVHLRPVSQRLALTATVADVGLVSALAAFSGGPFSQARLAYFLIPIAVGFRFRPGITAAATATVLLADLAQGFSHPLVQTEGGVRRLLVNAGYVAWVGLASTAGSWLLARRTRSMVGLAEQRAHLLADALTAEDRTRQRLSENLHDHAIQNLLSARHDLDEAASEFGHPALARADRSIADAVDDLRETIFELHPYVLEQAGLPSALAVVARRAAQRGGFTLDLDLAPDAGSPADPILFAAARELLANAAQHADASEVRVSLHRADGRILLRVADDGRGLERAALSGRVADGHIGLLTQRARIEAIGGTFAIESRPGEGSAFTITVPADGA
jgi:two-component system NarL family sensor kinase